MIGEPIYQGVTMNIYTYKDLNIYHYKLSHLYEVNKKVVAIGDKSKSRTFKTLEEVYLYLKIVSKIKLK